MHRANALLIVTLLVAACTEPGIPGRDRSPDEAASPVCHSLTEIGQGLYRELSVVDLDERDRILVQANPNSVDFARAFVWDSGRRFTVRVPIGYRGVHVSDMNERGDIVGGATTGHVERAFMWRQGVPFELPLSGRPSFAVGINERGTVAGTMTADDGSAHAFLWREGAVQDLGRFAPQDLNEADQVIGFTEDFRGVLWTGAETRDIGTLGGATISMDWLRINDAGQVSGAAWRADETVHAFLWTDGLMQDLGTLGGSQSYAVALNNRGDVVGGSELPGGNGTHAVLWRDGTMIDLGAEPTVSLAMDVNEHGQVAAETNGPNGFLWDAGVTSTLSVPIGSTGWYGVRKINERGVVAGSVTPERGSRVLLWRPSRCGEAPPPGDGELPPEDDIEPNVE